MGDKTGDKMGVGWMKDLGYVYTFRAHFVYCTYYHTLRDYG